MLTIIQKFLRIAKQDYSAIIFEAEKTWPNR